MGERFHILVGARCNNNCLFCMERRGDPALLSADQTHPDRVRRELEAHVDAGEVMFASGEPTLLPQLPEMIGLARQLGYRRIGLTTNGRRLGYEAYTRRLLDSGLNHLVVSLHGHDARSHDALTRTPGSFDQTLAGLRSAVQLRERYRLTLHSSTVVSRRNLGQLAAICEVLRPFELDQHVFNVTQPLGRAATMAESILARYSDVATAFERLLETVPATHAPLFLVDIPHCTTERLPSAVRGYVEAAFFNVTGPDGRSATHYLRQHKAARHGEKRTECGACRYDAACPGVWREYVRIFGWDEFIPVPPPRAATRERT